MTSLGGSVRGGWGQEGVGEVEGDGGGAEWKSLDWNLKKSKGNGRGRKRVGEIPIGDEMLSSIQTNEDPPWSRWKTNKGRRKASPGN